MKRLVVFTMNGCPHCEELKEELKQENLDYTEYEIFEHPFIWDQIVKETGNEYLPTIFIQTDDEGNGLVFVPEKDFNTKEELMNIIKTNII